MRALLRTPVDRPAATLVVLALTTVGLGAGLARLRIDNTVSRWLPAGDRDWSRYEAFQEIFGGDDFLLVAAGPLEPFQPERHAELRALERSLAELPGVTRVDVPFDARDPVARARREMPRLLAAVSSACVARPQSASLWRLDAELNVARVLLEDDPAGGQALVAARRAQRSALAALARIDSSQSQRLTGRGADWAPPHSATAAQALPPLFSWAFARGAEARARGYPPELVTELPRLDAVMRWVLARDPLHADGGPHLYFLARHAALPVSRGGDPSRCLPHFTALSELDAGRGLLARVLLAELYAPGLAATPAGSSPAEARAAQRRAWQRFRQLLLEVLEAPRAADEPLTAAVARRRARVLLLDPEEHGVILPEGESPPPVGPALASGWAPGPAARALRSRDGRRVAFLLSLSGDPKPGERHRLVTEVEHLLDGQPDALGPLHLVGPDAITRALDQGSRQSLGRLFPWVALTLAVVLWLALGRSLSLVLGILVVAGLSSVWTLGLLGWSGRPLNLVLVLIPAILAVLTTATALHLASRFLQLGGAPPRSRRARVECWMLAAEKTYAPCGLTAATTAAGFASLATSPLGPVRDLGLFTAFGVVCSALLVFTLLPLALSRLPWVRPRPELRGGWRLRHARHLGLALARHREQILLSGGAVALLGLLGLGRLEVASDVLRFFPPEHPAPTRYAEVEEHLIGLTPLQIWLHGERDELLSAETLAGLDEVLAQARRRPLVTDVLSPLELPGLGLEHPLDRAALLRALLSPELPGLERYYAEGADGAVHLRLTLPCRTGRDDAFNELVGTLRGGLQEELPEVSAEVTGAVPILVRVQSLLVRTQLTSFALALVIVTGVLAFTFQRSEIVLVSLVPNLLPLLLVLGGMGWLGVPLDTATVTVAGIGFGLVVDDTIHFLHEYARGARLGERPQDALTLTLYTVGRPVITTSLAVAAGFACFALTPFRPTLAFGALIAAISLSALVCDLVLLPALLMRPGEARPAL